MFKGKPHHVRYVWFFLAASDFNLDKSKMLFGVEFRHMEESDTQFNPFPNKPWFLRVSITSPLKTLWEKEKLLVTSNFSFSHSCFLPDWRTFCHFHQVQNGSLQMLSVWKSLKFCRLEKG